MCDGPKYPSTPDRLFDQANMNSEGMVSSPKTLLKNSNDRTLQLILAKEKELYELREMHRALNLATAILGQ